MREITIQIYNLKKERSIFYRGIAKKKNSSTEITFGTALFYHHARVIFSRVPSLELITTADRWGFDQGKAICSIIHNVQLPRKFDS